MQKKQAVTDNADLYKRAVGHHQGGQTQQAQKLYEQILAIDPGHHGAIHNLGLICHAMGDIDGAIKLLSQASELKPGDQYLCNLGRVLFDAGKYKQALEALQKALKLNPQYSDTHVNLAAIYIELGKLDKAEAHAREALKLDRNNTEAYFNLGSSLKRQKKITESIEILEKALKLDPNHALVQALLLEQYQFTCDWERLALLKPKVNSMTEKIIEQGGKPALTPFTDISLNDDPVWNLKIAKAWSESIEQRVAHYNKKFSFADRKKKKEKISIGYISGDFCEHPLGHISQYLFACHDKKRFKIFAYATSKDDGSQVRRKYENDSDVFADVSGMDDLQAAQRIYDDGVDILVDLTGHTTQEKLGIAALRPAPVQVSLWGFAGTTGLKEMDYIIADRLVVPEDQQQYYSEEIIYIPDSLQINHKNESFSDKIKTRSDCGLPEGKFIFSMLNPSYKIEAVMFEVWMKLLKQVPDSVLWLSNHHELTESNLKKAAQERGISPDRFIFTKRLSSRAEYFKRLSFADLAMDTRIYNGGSTTMDALWAGVPVVTMLGKHYASRMSAGIITGANMPELIAKNLQEYEELALRLARNPFELKSLRQKLWKERKTCPLFDTGGYVVKLEKAYEKIWQEYSL